VSTLEHIPSVAETFTEIARVLRPGGVLAYTVPVEPWNRYMLGHIALSAVRLPALADGYARLVHRGLTHVNIWPLERWTEITRASGLDVVHTQPVLSPRATRVFETLLPLALASRAWRVALGKRPPHPRRIMNVFARAFRPLLLDDSPEGSNFLVVARKPA
jgi:SAM-dependent methyltransferase